MLSKAQIIWSIVGAVTGTTAYQAYEHRQDLLDAAGAEMTISAADSLELNSPPDPSLAPPSLDSKEGKEMLEKVAGYLDSARGTLQKSNVKSCQGYCDVKRDKCVRLANRERDLVAICLDEHEICYKGCEADGDPAASPYKGTGE
jgi:hypothetical protein